MSVHHNFCGINFTVGTGDEKTAQKINKNVNYYKLLRNQESNIDATITEPNMSWHFGQWLRGTVGRAIASDTKRVGFVSSHWQISIQHLFPDNSWIGENKETESIVDL